MEQNAESGAKNELQNTLIDLEIKGRIWDGKMSPQGNKIWTPNFHKITSTVLDRNRKLPPEASQHANDRQIRDTMTYSGNANQHPLAWGTTEQHTPPHKI